MFTGSLSPVSNRATWSENYELRDDEDGTTIDLTDVDEITIEVRDQTSGVMLSGTMTGGDVVVLSPATDGVFQWRFEASAMRELCAKTYDVGCVVERDDDEVQLLIGTMPVLDGIVT